MATAESEGTIQQIARTFGVDWPHLISQIVSFLIVCAILYRYAYRPVTAMLEARSQKISEGLANAEKIKTELTQTEAQRQEIITKANAEATRLIDEAHAAAARVEKQETQKAIAKAEQIVNTARESAEREHARMFAQLKGELGRLVVQTTTTVTGKILTPEDQQRLADEAAVQIKAA
jgi:F-type H+-transporting ATPase subunit b